MKYIAAVCAFFLAACMNPNDVFFQSHRYKMLQAEMTGQDAVFNYGDAKKPDHDLLVNQVRISEANRAAFEKEWIAKEQGYRKKDCTLQKVESNGVTYYICDAKKGFNGIHFVVYVVNVKADKGYVKIYRSMNKPTREELTKLVADLDKLYP